MSGMRFVGASALALAALASAQAPMVGTTATITLSPPVTAPAASVATGCAVVSSMSSSMRAANPQATAAFNIAPSVALACLQSVPVDVTNDVALIDYLLPFFSFHSTLGYLKNPPEGYLLPGVDIIGGFDEMRQKLIMGGYNNQYEFTSDVSSMLFAASDGHLSYTPALNTVFEITRGLILVSLSSDGLQLPLIYDLADVKKAENEGGYNPSDIASIDGIDIETYLINVPNFSKPQDPDAIYNALFPSIPSNAAGFGLVFSGPQLSLPDFHNVTFTNGTMTTYTNQAAIILQSMDGINSGAALHSLVELPAPMPTTTATPTAPPPAVSSTASPTVTGVPDYPSPVVISQSERVSGYFLDQAQDTCVLVLLAFEPAGTAFAKAAPNAVFLDFRNDVQTFISACQQDGRDKLIIDVRSNPGGDVFEGFELYRNLFPNSTNWSGSRIRSHPAFNLFAEAALSTGNAIDLINNSLDPDTGMPYPSASAFVGPVQLSEDSETEVMIYDFTNATTVTLDPDSPFIVTGYDPNTPPAPQPFATENIVILSDGFCASTCTIFTGLMAREAGVRTIAIGGRPLNAPMQAIGGVKGSQDETFAFLQAISAGIQSLGFTVQSGMVSPELAAVLPSVENPPLNPVDLTAASFNYRNAYAQNATDGPPLHFVYEAANCRIFNRLEYLNDITQSWADVANVAWRGGLCAPGSTASSDGTISDVTLGFSPAVVSAQQPYDGPGSLTNLAWRALLTNTSGTDADLANATTGAGNMGAGMNGTNSNGTKSGVAGMARGGGTGAWVVSVVLLAVGLWAL